MLLVQFQASVSQKERQQVLNTLGLTPQTVIQELQVHLVAVPPGQELTYAQRLSDAPGVAYAEPDYLIRALPYRSGAWPDVQK